MKITKKLLKRIIKEELVHFMDEKMEVLEEGIEEAFLGDLGKKVKGAFGFGKKKEPQAPAASASPEDDARSKAAIASWDKASAERKKARMARRAQKAAAKQGAAPAQAQPVADTGGYSTYSDKQRANKEKRKARQQAARQQAAPRQQAVSTGDQAYDEFMIKKAGQVGLDWKKLNPGQQKRWMHLMTPRYGRPGDDETFNRATDQDDQTSDESASGEGAWVDLMRRKIKDEGGFIGLDDPGYN